LQGFRTARALAGRHLTTLNLSGQPVGVDEGPQSDVNLTSETRLRHLGINVETSPPCGESVRIIVRIEHPAVVEKDPRPSKGEERSDIKCLGSVFRMLWPSRSFLR
jgi:hypothetical protein